MPANHAPIAKGITANLVCGRNFISAQLITANQANISKAKTSNPAIESDKICSAHWKIKILKLAARPAACKLVSNARCCR